MDICVTQSILLKWHEILSPWLIFKSPIWPILSISLMVSFGIQPICLVSLPETKTPIAFSFPRNIKIHAILISCKWRLMPFHEDSSSRILKNSLLKLGQSCWRKSVHSCAESYISYTGKLMNRNTLRICDESSLLQTWPPPQTCCNVFWRHVRHVEASHLKLASRLGPGRVTSIFWVILKMANGVGYQCKIELNVTSLYDSWLMVAGLTTM